MVLAGVNYKVLLLMTRPAGWPQRTGLFETWTPNGEAHTSELPSNTTVHYSRPVSAPIPQARSWHRPYLIVLLVANSMVLLGQLWPEGAPPFARWVDIGFLIASWITLAVLLRRVGSAAAN